jgi:hypothetical protein
MPYESMPWDKQIFAVDQAIAKIDEAILALHSQNFAVQSRLMLRRAQMTRFVAKVRASEITSGGEHADFRESIDSNAKLSRTIQARIGALANRAAALRNTRVAALRAQARTKKSTR